MIKLSGNDVTFSENTVSQSGQRLLTKSGIRGSVLSGQRTTGFHWNGHRFPPPTSGSVLYLPGYPAQGSTIQDFSGNGNDGTITGALWKRLPSGLWYLDFDGTDDLVVADGVASGSFFDGAHTMIAWARLSSWASDQAIFTAGKLTNSFRDGIYFSNSQQKIRAEIANGSTPNNVISTGTFTDDADWHFFAMVVDEDMHINNFIIDTTDYGSDSTVTDSITTYDKFYIGQLTHGAANISPWGGDITLPRVISGELTADGLQKIRARERHLLGV